MTDQNEGGGAPDEPLLRFSYYFGYSEYVPVCFKQEQRSDYAGGEIYTRNSCEILDESSSFQTYRKPSGLNIFVEKTYGRNWVQHEFIYER